MKLNNPFNFPKDENSTTILNDYVFSNNRGLALLVLVIIVVIIAIYDNFRIPITNRLKSSVNAYSVKFRCHPILKRYSSW